MKEVVDRFGRVWHMNTEGRWYPDDDNMRGGLMIDQLNERNGKLRWIGKDVTNEEIENMSMKNYHTRCDHYPATTTQARTPVEAAFKYGKDCSIVEGSIITVIQRTEDNSIDDEQFKFEVKYLMKKVPV